MKVTIEIDATPQEIRTLMGLPDIEPIQKELMEKIREKALSSVDASDPATLMSVFMPTSEQLKNMESLQSSFWQAIGKSLDLTAGSKDK